MLSANYVSSRRSALVPEEITQVIENTLRKERMITCPTELDGATEPNVICKLYIQKLKQESL